MKTVHLTERAGEDGVLHVSVPRLDPGSEYDVVLVVQPKGTVSSPRSSEDLGWPPGYFEETFGSIADESFVRPPQGEMPERAKCSFAANEAESDMNRGNRNRFNR